MRSQKYVYVSAENPDLSVHERAALMLGGKKSNFVKFDVSALGVGDGYVYSAPDLKERAGYMHTEAELRSALNAKIAECKRVVACVDEKGSFYNVDSSILDTKAVYENALALLDDRKKTEEDVRKKLEDAQQQNNPLTGTVSGPVAVPAQLTDSDVNASVRGAGVRLVERFLLENSSFFDDDARDHIGCCMRQSCEFERGVQQKVRGREYYRDISNAIASVDNTPQVSEREPLIRPGENESMEGAEQVGLILSQKLVAHRGTLDSKKQSLVPEKKSLQEKIDGNKGAFRKKAIAFLEKACFGFPILVTSFLVGMVGEKKPAAAGNDLFAGKKSTSAQGGKVSDEQRTVDKSNNFR